MNCSLPGSFVHGILQARILEWVATLLQGIFPTQELNLGLLCFLHWQAGCTQNIGWCVLAVCVCVCVCTCPTYLVVNYKYVVGKGGSIIFYGGKVVRRWNQRPVMKLHDMPLRTPQLPISIGERRRS